MGRQSSYEHERHFCQHQGCTTGHINLGYSISSESKPRLPNADSINPDTTSWDMRQVTDLSYTFRMPSQRDPTRQIEHSVLQSLSHTFDGARYADPDTPRTGIPKNVITLDSTFANAPTANPDTTNWNTGGVTSMKRTFANARLANPDTGVGYVPSCRLPWHLPKCHVRRSKYRKLAARVCTDTLLNVSRGRSSQPRHSHLEYIIGHDNGQPLLTAQNARRRTPQLGTPPTFKTCRQCSAMPRLQSLIPAAGMLHHSKMLNPSFLKMRLWPTPMLPAGNTSQVTTLARVFKNASVATPDTSSWDTGNVVDLEGAFENATSANPDVSAWNIGTVQNLASVFKGASLVAPNVSGWNTSQATTLKDIFKDTISAAPNVSNWNTENVQDMSGAFSGAPNAAPDLNQLGLLKRHKNGLFSSTEQGLTSVPHSELLVKLESQNSTFRLSLHAGSSLYNVIGSNKIENASASTISGLLLTEARLMAVAEMVSSTQTPTKSVTMGKQPTTVPKPVPWQTISYPPG